MRDCLKEVWNARGQISQGIKIKENRSYINLVGWSIDEWSWIMDSIQISKENSVPFEIVLQHHKTAQCCY